MTPATMTREDALAAARALWGDRADTVVLGKSHFLGVQRSAREWDWRVDGGSWTEAVEKARAGEDARRVDASAKGKALAEKFGRVVVRIDGDSLVREWHGKQYTVTRVADGFEFAGKVHSSLTSIAKIITGARAISGPRFFGVDGGKERAS